MVLSLSPRNAIPITSNYHGRTGAAQQDNFAEESLSGFAFFPIPIPIGHKPKARVASAQHGLSLENEKKIKRRLVQKFEVVVQLILCEEGNGFVDVLNFSYVHLDPAQHQGLVSTHAHPP